MNQICLLTGAGLGALAVLLGAFGAHALKKIATEQQLSSFETGVKYQMYHAVLLLFMGSNLSFQQTLENQAAQLIIVGIILFSFSIYALVGFSIKNKKMRFLGPITPIGGLCLLGGWILLFISFLK